MGKQEVIAVFDVGKTNKKILLFDDCMNAVYQREEKFEATFDEDGFECDDIELIENWIKNTLIQLINGGEFEIKGVNFSSYGASLVFLDCKGKPLTPIYNYMKEVSPEIKGNLFKTNGGEEEFCRKTGSPALPGLLNSGVQMLWLKKERPNIFQKVTDIVHFPQYLSYLLTQQIVSESTSIGCHTFLWDFDGNKYSDWLMQEQIKLPYPKPNSHIFTVPINGKTVNVGIGIHDSSSSLVPYLQGSAEKFILISTGTWSININPYNHLPLTPVQLKNDCLNFLSTDQQLVKSSRLFMGHIHDVNTQRLCSFYNLPADSFKTVKLNETILKEFLRNRNFENKFFSHGLPNGYLDEEVDLSKFINFSAAYHRLMFDLTLLNYKSINLILSEHDEIKNLYISGGFSRNEIFVRLLATMFPYLRVFTSEIDNSSALGAALVIYNSFKNGKEPKINLGLKEYVSVINT